MKYLKSILTILTIFCFVLLGNHQASGQSLDAIDNYFADQVQNSQYKSVMVNPKIFDKLITDSQEDLGEDVKELISKLQGLHILSSQSGNGLDQFADAKNTMSKTKYEELLYVQESKNDQVVFFIKENDKKIKELIMIQGKPDAFSIISFIGDDIDLKVLIKLSQSLDVEGMDHFEKLKNK